MVVVRKVVRLGRTRTVILGNLIPEEWEYVELSCERRGEELVVTMRPLVKRTMSEAEESKAVHKASAAEALKPRIYESKIVELIKSGWQTVTE
ncbi:MAG: hypothetical protein QW599_05520 [Nitrososphaerota archaeon]